MSQAAGARRGATVLILSWNRREELRRTLAEVAAVAPPETELLVVDNGSTDGTPEMVHSEFPAITLVALRENRGAAGRNAGLEQAGDVVLLLDDDSHPAPGVIEAGLAAMAEDPKLAVLGCRIVDPATGTDWTERFPSGRITFWGCGALVRQAALLAVGGFHPAFGVYVEELDVSARLLDAGWRIEYRDDLVVYHRLSPVQRSAEKLVRHTARNHLIFIHLRLSGREQRTAVRRFLTHELSRHLLRPRRLLWFLAGCLEYRRLKRAVAPAPISDALEQHYLANYFYFEPLWQTLWRKLRGQSYFALRPEVFPGRPKQPPR